jgi:hypothetical protein
VTDSKAPVTRLVGFFAVLFLIAGVAIALGGRDEEPGAPDVSLGDVRLISAGSCDDLVAWFRSVATAMPAGALGGYGPIMFATGDVASGAAGRDMATSAPTTTAVGETAAPGAPDFSGTNVQERDVDEPDTVKTNGKILVNVGPDRLDIVDVSGDEPALLSTVPIEQGGTEILLSGDRVLALTNVWRPTPGADTPVSSDERVMMMPAPGEPVTVLTAIDISDPADPQVVETRELPGSYRSARATDGAARIVLVNMPMLPAPGPAVYESGDQTEIDRQLEQWKTQAIASMTLEDWAPGIGDDCDSVTRTPQPEGLSTTTILTLDLQGSLDELDRDTVVADAGTVYASTDRLYLATSRWSQSMQPDGTVRTELHAFDIADGATTSYIGSGDVDGYLLNQYSLSAKDGYIRVATTQQAPWDPSTGTQDTSNALTVLQERDDALVEVGSVDGLGPTERIQAVRFLGDVAYVVTFRQTDPLFAIDLSDPTAPRVAGELKIPGYSAYLHPIGDDRLLGVGQDADDQGRVKGTQLATFDISDLASTARLDAARIDGASSPVEYDPHAFLWWAPTRTVVVPIEVYPQVECPPNAECIAPDQQPYLGAVAFTVGDDGTLAEAGRVTHAGRGDVDNGYFPIQRTLVVGDSLYTVSQAGVLKSDLSSFADQGFAAFPQPEQPSGGVVEPMPMPVEGDGGTGAGTSSSGGAGTPTITGTVPPETTVPPEG